MKALHELVAGESTSIGNKIYVRCADCEKVIRVNKPVLGSMHVCLTDDEKRAKGMYAASVQAQLNYVAALLTKEGKQ